MLVAGLISADELSSKIEELSSYDVSAINTIEKLANHQAKGLKTGNGGLEQPMIVQASQKDEMNIKEKLQNLFTGNKQANEARDSTDADLRRKFGR